MRSTKLTLLLPLPLLVLLLHLLLLLSLSCEVEVPTEVFDNPLDVEEAENKGILTPALVFFPDSVSVDAGGTVSLQVFALEVVNLGGAHIQISYDNTKLSFSSVSAGDFLNGATQPLFVYEDDPSAGTLDIYTSFLGTDSTSVSGTGNLANLVISTTALGQAMLRYTTECELVDPDDNPIEIKGFGEGMIDAK